MKIYKFVMVVLSFVLFVISAILLLLHGVVSPDDMILEHRDVGYLFIILVFSLMTAILAGSFPHRLYKRSCDIDAIEARYNKATMQLHHATKMISDRILKTIVDDVVKEVRLPSLLEKEAKDIAKDFEDVEKVK